MTCNSTFSESGALCSIDGCHEYRRLLDHNTTLQDEVDKLSTREDELNALCLDYQIDLDALRQERDVLIEELSACTESPGGCGYWREAARQREKERDALKARLADTVYDGTPATLPPEGVRVAVKIKGATCSSGYVSDSPAVPFWWIDSLQDFRKITIGDTWWPLPGGGE